MGKAIFVLDDMPVSCKACPCFDNEYILCNLTFDKLDLDIYYNSRVPKCPLKEMPEKLSLNDYDEHVPEDCKKLLEYYNDGFNDCIDKIIGTED